MKIRNATAEDVKSIARVHVESWWTTYKDIVPNEYLQSLTYEAREQLWEQAIPKGHVFAAENENGQVVGFACGGKERTGDYPDYRGEIYAIYLLEEYQKQGFGTELIRAVVRHLQENQLNSMLIWVMDGNEAAFFYKALGGLKIDSTVCEIGGRRLKETAYGWKDISLFIR
ncbi:N-acetyltransferase family protein [Bacillus sp. AK031]